jgi:hypothetical protein
VALLDRPVAASHDRRLAARDLLVATPCVWLVAVSRDRLVAVSRDWLVAVSCDWLVVAIPEWRREETPAGEAGRGSFTDGFRRQASLKIAGENVNRHSCTITKEGPLRHMNNQNLPRES